MLRVGPRVAFRLALRGRLKGRNVAQRTPGKIDDHLMMLQSLAALDRSQVPDDAVMAVAHSRQMAVFEELSRALTFLLSRTAGAQDNRFTWARSRGIDDKAVKLYLSSRVDNGLFRHAV
jgi:hypothetical protein